ncbi:O-antigen ligase family protein [Mordavella massiliensis]|uniref:O-antigen ligase family protein n=1 Tax=Mordavella massiliensis TaxID=1871024 RepID=UPI00210E1391
MKNCTYVKETDNSNFIVLYLFQFSFLTVIIPIIPISISAIILTFLLLVFYFLVKGKSTFYISKKVLIFALIPIVLLLVKGLTSPKSNVSSIVLDYMSYGCMSMYFGSRYCKTDNFLESCRKVSLFTFIMLCLLPVFNIDLFDGYMRYGYAMLPVVDVFLYQCIENKQKRIWYAVLYIVALLEMAIFGARGCLFSHALFVFLICFYVYSPQKRFLLKLSIGIISLILFLNLESVLIFLKNFFNNLGYRVYAIDKYIMQLEGGFESASSGRSTIWEMALDVIKEHPFWGGTIGNDINGLEYYHNFLLQIGAEFGVIILIICIVAIVIMVIKVLKTKDKSKRYVFCLLFSITFGRLMFSSSYWLRPELWLLIGMYLSGKFTNERSY